MRELITAREILKEIYEHVLMDLSKVEPQYSTIHKYGQIPQSKVHEYNEACLKFASIPRCLLGKIYIAIPYHLFRSKVISLEIKVQGINTDNQLADHFTKDCAQDNFQRNRLNLIGW